MGSSPERILSLLFYLTVGHCAKKHENGYAAELPFYALTPFNGIKRIYNITTKEGSSNLRQFLPTLVSYPY